MSDSRQDQVEWRREPDLVPYRAALDMMTARNAAIADGEADELVWLLEHPPVYTAGTSAAPGELLDPCFEVVAAGRGGRYTYHGPGQRIGYVLLDLRQRARDVRGFVHALEGWVIATLADFGVESFRRDGRIGIWTSDIDGRALPGWDTRLTAKPGTLPCARGSAIFLPNLNALASPHLMRSLHNDVVQKSSWRCHSGRFSGRVSAGRQACGQRQCCRRDPARIGK